MSLTRPAVWGLFCVRATEFQFSDFSVNLDLFELRVLLLLKTASDSWHQESQKVKEVIIFEKERQIPEMKMLILCNKRHCIWRVIRIMFRCAYLQEHLIR